MRHDSAAGYLRSLSIALASALALTCVLTGQTPPQPYRILLVNDDGVRAPGLLAVAQALAPIAQITIVAPSENQSGKGHSIATSEPIFVDRVTLPGDLEAFSVVSTPATCVKVAVGALLSHKPNLVVSGINRGYNLGMVTYVSGTVGAAREAALMGIPSIAASVDTAQTDYAPAAGIVRQVVELVRQHGLEPGVFLNVNVPRGTANAIKGVKATRQSRSSGTERFEEFKTPSGRRFFFSVWNEPTGDADDTDVFAIEHSYAAVTPLHAGELDAAAYDTWRKIIGG